MVGTRTEQLWTIRFPNAFGIQAPTVSIFPIRPVAGGSFNTLSRTKISFPLPANIFELFKIKTNVCHGWKPFAAQDCRSVIE